ncbi:PEP-CTERM sorting domain-containing protein [Nitrosomonas ureae]|uniref:PEP-CTERM protein-sorting domain-containing protein n=1 Tax=Nitrosomonas ureae TaxID=44577 RepID=A0A1H9EA25_9PROT|nr:PEP-CTERM sorting domain-containing protein [Nitrosomonas ureae]SEQ22509.1 PEP-CTERM protein-sorting domain-containing protein [Nitrosomonas ureae]
MNKLTLGIVAAILSTSANAEYKFTDLHFSGDHPYSQVYAINDLNQAVGFEFIKAGPVTWKTPTLWDINSETKTYLLEPRNNRDAQALDINNKGDVVVTVSDNFNLGLHGYLFTNGSKEEIKLPANVNPLVRDLDINESSKFIGRVFSDIGANTALWENPNTPIVLNKVVNAINDRGQMAGQITLNGERHAALFDGNATIDIGTGYDWIRSAEAIDLNNNGQVIATGFGAGSFLGHKSFLWDNGHIRSLQSVNGPSDANSINDFGIVVGNQFIDRGFSSEILNSAAVIWDGHNQFNLNDFLDQDTKDAGWILVTANDINNKGWIVGEALNTITEGLHAYALSPDEMLSPIPEPSTYLMLLAGLGLLGYMGRRTV